MDAGGVLHANGTAIFRICVTGPSGVLRIESRWCRLESTSTPRSKTTSSASALQRGRDVFPSSGLGKLKQFQLQLHIDPDVQPVAQKARRIPVALQKAVEKKLEELLQQEIIEKANGLVERQNRTLLKAIRASVAEQRDWRESLQAFLLAYRTTPHPSTGKSPAELIYGRELRTKLPEVDPPPAPGRRAVQAAHDRSGKRGKEYADRRRRATPHNIRVGDKVLVRVPRKVDKLSAAFFREPYTVVSVNGSQLTVRRPGDGKLFKRNSTFCKRNPTMPATLQFQVPSTKTKTATVSEYLEKLTQRLKLTHDIAIQSSNSRHQRNKRLYEKKLTQHQFEEMIMSHRLLLAFQTLMSLLA
ncbi:uncharacterized protein LOC122387159 [Amphibalanus amphitrite]|uniref:uncharacterized protein LOC122387159 n=1 Tax=Amphibalanus amphitrite TaxID=1232801 RepID=UPI001C9288E4|nr:uncharacterized protein LOC122387159 [Amphibalanus amphitrite]